MKRVLPLLAAVAAAGLVVLLLSSGERATTPAPEPDITTSTTARSSVLSRWLVPAGTRATSVVDLERQNPVLQVAPRDPAVDTGAGVYDEAFTTSDQVGRTVRFRASVQVAGPGRAGLFLRARSFEGASRRSAPDLAIVATPDDRFVRAGGWQRLTVELVVPEGTAQLVYGVSLDGGGSVLVDEADEL